MVQLPDVERTPEGRRVVVVSRTMAADRETVWEVLTDTAQWPEWGPSVSAVRSDDRYVRAGSTGEVQVLGGPWVGFEVRTCRDYRWTWSVARIPATGHRVERTESGSRASFEIPLAAAGYAPVCVRALQHIEQLAGAGTE